MTIDEALIHFKSGYDLCKKLGITPTNYSKWKKQNFIPLKQQFLINQLTGANMPIDIDKEAMDVRIGTLAKK
jgi:hypothetical protein